MEITTPRPPEPPWLGEVVITFYGTTLDDLAVQVQAQQGVLTLAEAEALALAKLQQRAARG